MKVKRDELVGALTEYATQAVPERDAAYYATEVIEAQIRKSPRSNVLKSAVSDVEASAKLKDTKMSYDIDLPSYISINFHGHGPLTFMKQIHDDLEERANKNGLVMAAFTNGKSMHTLHTWVQGLAKRGLLAIAVCNGGPKAVVPFNGTEGLFGTNPLAYGIPGKNGEVFCVDMATSEIPFFEFMDGLKNNKPLRERAAVDQEGEFTTDAKAAVLPGGDPNDPVSSIVPMGGGYKGYYIVYLMEVLTSALIGMPASPQMSTEFVAEEHGAILLVLSPKAMGTQQSFDESIEALHVALKAQKAKAGTVIQVPGERNNSKFRDAGELVEIDDETAAKLGFKN